MVIRMYTDGASKGNPGRGGYGVILSFGNYRKELSAGYRKTTNNRMELMAVLEGLQQIKTAKYPIVVYSDSKYVVDAIEKGWLKKWQKKGFVGTKNADLWKRYIELSQPYTIRFEWVKGHNGHPENEQCDRLATQACLNAVLLIDQPYELTQTIS